MLTPDLPKSSASAPLRRILEVSYCPARKAAVPGHGCPGKAAFARMANQAVCVADAVTVKDTLSIKNIQTVSQGS